MCEICKKRICPAGCPNYRGDSAELGRARGRCFVCGAVIGHNDDVYLRRGRTYCAICGSTVRYLREKRYVCVSVIGKIKKERGFNDREKQDKTGR